MGAGTKSRVEESKGTKVSEDFSDSLAIKGQGQGVEAGTEATTSSWVCGIYNVNNQSVIFRFSGFWGSRGTKSVVMSE